MPDIEETAGLVKRCIRNDEKAWNELYIKYEKMIYYWILNTLAQKGRQGRAAQEDAEEIFCTVWLKVVEKLGTLNAPEKFPGWLKITAVRTVQDFLRRANTRKRDISLEDPVGEDGAIMADLIPSDIDVEAEALSKDEINRLNKAVSELPEEEQFMMVQHFYYNIKLEQLSRMTGRPIGTIGSIISRAKERLKGVLEDG
ncbi:MAG: sigma-70 family RNA polymerase sigma factor [Spirochaetes bacterium]|nr:sigma-70 family RNA polymerase sigma factor [Spirochaetota bacterium]